MSQTSIASYFATRKRPAGEDADIVRAKKVFVLDPSSDFKVNKTIEKANNAAGELVYPSKEKSIINELKISKLESQSPKEIIYSPRSSVVTKLNFDSASSPTSNMTIKRSGTPKCKPRKLIKDISNQPNIQTALLNMQATKISKNTQEVNEKTPPTTPIKNALDSVPTNTTNLSLNEIRNKLSRSARLAELKASLSRFNKSAVKLKELEKKTASITEGPTIKEFKSIQLEVQLSPKKSSPVKPYLSPRKEISSPRKNLLGLLTPGKSSTSSSLTTKIPAYQRFQGLTSPGKPSLTLPFKYRGLAEMFRSIDTVCAMLFNRKEMITFNKLKPAVQEMMRRNLTLQHFAQIKQLYPDAFTFKWEKMRLFASRKENYELVITPDGVKTAASEEEGMLMNPNILLERRRILFNNLIEKVKNYHNEFLLSLDPPMEIPRDKITRWHPEFDIEKIPDVEESELPKEPEEEKMTTGQEVLEKAKSLFNCNTRMEAALERLKQMQENKTTEEKQIVNNNTAVSSTLKGIPKALLEKVRAKQAAKALDKMTRSTTQDKEAEKYGRLPEIARLLRNTFVAEKKGVLSFDECLVKLNNSYRSYLTNSEIEEHLRLLSKEVPGWLELHEVRKCLFVKLSRDGDMVKVMTKLEAIAKQKAGT